MLTWITLNDIGQLNDIITQSAQVPCFIFKHSTRCSISDLAKSRLEKKWNFAAHELQAYYLDLLQYRAISNQVAEQFGVAHQSPQALLIVNGECIYDESHNAISVEALAEVLATV